MRKATSPGPGGTSGWDQSGLGPYHHTFSPALAGETRPGSPCLRAAMCMYLAACHAYSQCSVNAAWLCVLHSGQQTTFCKIIPCEHVCTEDGSMAVTSLVINPRALRSGLGCLRQNHLGAFANAGFWLCCGKSSLGRYSLSQRFEVQPDL